MNPPVVETPFAEPPPLPSARRFWIVIGLSFVLAWLADFLLWAQAPGLSFGLCMGAAALVVRFWHGRARDGWKVKVALGLMLAAMLGAAWQLSLSNSLVLFLLLAVIVGESCFWDTPGGLWGRCSEAIVGWLAAAGRWVWLARRVQRGGWEGLGLTKAVGQGWTRALRMSAPALCLMIVFIVVFRSGNAVFSEICGRFVDQAIAWITSWDITFGRLLFWAAASTVALVLIQPRRGAAQVRLWARSLPRWQREDQTVAIWQSRLVLIVLNALFFAVNTIDAFYLWQHGALPTDVSFSQFVHQGVYSLIVAVLLSAVVLAAMFQQSAEVIRGFALKGLALFWIVQNGVLIAGVLLRLKLYVEAYQLSELRVYVGCFLLLVTIGFALLAWHVVRGESLNSLIFRNALAAFALFFVLQFIDVAGGVARYNVAQWRAHPDRTLDLDYLAALGPGSWPSLVAVAKSSAGNNTTITRARVMVEETSQKEIDRWIQFDWRSTQLYRDSRSWQLIADAARLRGHHR